MTARHPIAALLVTLAVAGCGGSPAPRRAGGLHGRHACPDAPDFECASLTVERSRSDGHGDPLELAVAMTRSAAPRGVLIFLAGGPGQPGLPVAQKALSLLGPAAGGYRLVVFDQRGTGAGALRCPALQEQVGYSDLAVPSDAAVRACASALGADRRWYATRDTVADLDDLRRALGARRVTLDGVSYGTLVAEAYARAHPADVDRLVLDSVVPQAGADPFQRANLRAVPRVLREVCGTCAADLAAGARAVGGPALLDTLDILSIADPTFRGVPQALRVPARMRELVGDVRDGSRADAGELSQGLHAATLCADVPVRADDIRAVRIRTPLGRSASVANGLARTCRLWPRDAAAPVAGGPAVIRAPALLLAGSRDLSTPLEWAREQLRHMPRGRLVVLRGAGHGVQTRASSDRGRAAVRAFLLSRSGTARGPRPGSARAAGSRGRAPGRTHPCAGPSGGRVRSGSTCCARG